MHRWCSVRQFVGPRKRGGLSYGALKDNSVFKRISFSPTQSCETGAAGLQLDTMLGG